MKFRTLISKRLKALRPKTSWRELLVFGIPFAVGTAILISIGPVLQQYLFSLSETTAPSLYDAAHSIGIAQFPSFPDWLAYALDPVFILQAAIISIFCLRRQEIGSATVSAGIASFTVFTAFDILAGIIHGETNIRSYMGPMLANVLGSIVYSLIVGVFLFIRQHIVAKSSRASPILLIGVAPLLSIVMSGATYWLLTWVYQPTHVRFEASVAIPSNGFVAPGNSTGQTLGEDRYALSPSFSFFPEGTRIERVAVTSLRGQPFVDFQAPAGAVQYDLEATLYINCMRDSDLGILHISQPVSLLGVTAARIQFDEGFNEIHSLSPAELALESSRLNIFSIKQQGSPGRQVLRIESMLDGDDRLRFRNVRNFTTFLSGSLIGERTRQPRWINRALTIQTNHGTRRVILRPGPIHNRARLGNCMPLAGSQFRDAVAGSAPEGVIQLPAGTIEVGLLARISQRIPDRGEVDSRGAEVSVRGATGPVQFDGPQYGEDEPTFLGRARMIAIGGSSARIDIEGRAIEVPRGQWLSGTGSIVARISRGGQVSVSGEADGLWNGDVRLNPTRWERMSSELQVSMLAFLGFVLLALVRFYRPVMKKLLSNEIMIPL